LVAKEATTTKDPYRDYTGGQILEMLLDNDDNIIFHGHIFSTEAALVKEDLILCEIRDAGLQALPCLKTSIKLIRILSERL